MEQVTVRELLKKDISGKVVCFPTDTVYGVGAKIDDIEAIKKIYELKNRDFSKPLAVLTPSKDLSYYVKDISDDAKLLMDKYWPGSLTLIFHKTSNVNDLVTSQKETIGFRMPDSEIALKILEKFGVMATTSINISGMPPINDIDTIIKNFGEKIDYIVTDSAYTSNVASTVIDVTKKPFVVVRCGMLKINE